MWDINLPIFLQWHFGAQPPKLITTNISGYTVIHNSLFYECSYLETNSLHSFHYLPEELNRESPVNLVLENCAYGNWRLVNNPFTINVTIDFAGAG